MVSATTSTSDDCPTLFTFQTYDLANCIHRYHHLSVLLVRSELNYLLMMNWVWIAIFLPVLEQLVCNCYSLLAWLGQPKCTWLLNPVTVVLAIIFVCPPLLLAFSLRHMVGFITWLYWIYSSSIQSALGSVNYGDYWCFASDHYFFYSGYCYLQVRGA